MQALLQWSRLFPTRVNLCNALRLGKDAAASQLSCAFLRGLDNIYALESSWLSVWFWMQFKVLILNVKYFASWWWTCFSLSDAMGATVTAVKNRWKRAGISGEDLLTKIFTLFCLTLSGFYYVYFWISSIFLWLFGRPWGYVCVRKWNKPGTVPNRGWSLSMALNSHPSSTEWSVADCTS